MFKEHSSEMERLRNDDEGIKMAMRKAHHFHMLYKDAVETIFRPYYEEHKEIIHAKSLCDEDKVDDCFDDFLYNYSVNTKCYPSMNFLVPGLDFPCGELPQILTPEKLLDAGAWHYG